MKKHMSILLVLLTMISLFSGTQAVLANGNVELTYPSNGEYINYELGVQVKGSLTSGYEPGSAKIYIDGVLKKTLADDLTDIDEVITSDGVSDLNFGNHKITLEAIYSGQKASATKEFILTGVYDKAISDAMAGKGKESSFASGLLYSFTGNDYYAFSNSNGSVSFTRKSAATEGRANAYFSFGNSYVLNHGKFIFKTKLTVSDPSHSIALLADNMSQQNFDSTSLVKNGKFLTTDIVCESDAAYDLEIIYNLDKNTKTYKVNGEILVDEASTDKPIGQIRSFSVRWSAGAAEQGAKITFDDLKLFHTTYLPLISNLGYILNNETTVAQNAWSDGCLNYEAQSVTVVMDKALNDIPDVLLKKSGTEVTASVSLSSDKTKVIVTPDDGFEPGFPYSITLSGVICDGATYAKSIGESFRTQSHADVTFSVNSDGLLSSSQLSEGDVVSAWIDNIILPDGTTDATYILSLRSGLELVAMTGKTLSNTADWQSGFELKLPPIAEDGQYEVYLMVIDSYKECNSVSKYMSIR